jgi:hypothetical protein
MSLDALDTQISQALVGHPAVAGEEEFLPDWDADEDAVDDTRPFRRKPLAEDDF